MTTTRDEILQAAQSQLGLVPFDYKFDFDDNDIVCEVYAPFWVEPYEKLGYSVPFKLGNFVVNFYTLKPSTYGKTEGEIAYLWFFRNGKPSKEDNEKFEALLELALSFYKQDTNKPLAPIWAPISLLTQLRLDTGCPILTENEYVYSTKVVAELNTKNLTRKRAGVKRFIGPEFETISLLDTTVDFDNLWKLACDWLEAKQARSSYPNFEIVEYVLKHARELVIPPEGVVVKAVKNKQQLGFTFSSALSKNAWSCLARFSIDLQYLSDFLFAQTALFWLGQGKGLCHDGGSAGKPGLAAFKQRYLTNERVNHYAAVVPNNDPVTIEQLALIEKEGIHF
jgi:hypothetical protein